MCETAWGLDGGFVVEVEREPEGDVEGGALGGGIGGGAEPAAAKALGDVFVGELRFETARGQIEGEEGGHVGEEVLG